LNKLMTNPRSKAAREAGEPSDTTKTYLREIFIEEKYGRRKEITSKYLEKGKEGEEGAFDLLGDVTGRLLINNKERLTNDYITGEWDTTHPIENPVVVIDTKTSWDIWTFAESEMKPVYEDQLNGYMWLLGLHRAELAYCLIDTPEHFISSMFYRETFKQSDLFLSDQKKYEIAKNNIYTIDGLEEMKAIHFDSADTSDFIPISKQERVKRFEIDRDEMKIEEYKTRIIAARRYLNSLTL